MISDYQNQSCTVHHQATEDIWGNPVTTDSTVDCRYVQKTENVQTAEGIVLVTNARVELAASVSIAPGDSLTYDSVKWRVVAVIAARGLDGEVLHWVAYLR